MPERWRRETERPAFNNERRDSWLNRAGRLRGPVLNRKPNGRMKSDGPPEGTFTVHICVRARISHRATSPASIRKKWSRLIRGWFTSRRHEANGIHHASPTGGRSKDDRALRFLRRR